MPKARGILGATIFLGALFALGYLATGYWLREVRPFEETDNAYVRSHLAQLSPRIPGYIKSVHFTDHQFVHKGTLLVTLDDREYRARVAHAEAALAAARAAVATLSADIQVQDARVEQRAAAIGRVQAEVKRAGRDLARQRDLARDGAASVQTEDAAQAAHSQANASLVQARAAWEEAKRQRNALQSRLTESMAAVTVSAANLRLARIDLQHTRIHSPIDGTLAERRAQVGQQVQPGALLAHLVPSGDVFVEANFKETQLELMRAGQVVELEIDAFPERAFRGVVTSASPASGAEFSILPPENATGNFTKIVRRVPVRIDFAKDVVRDEIKPGLSVTARVRVR